jgi:hypothetical protein
MSARSGLGRDLAIGACAISAGVHAALTPAHFAEGAAAGAGFLAAALLLAALVWALSRTASRWPATIAALTLAGLLGSYLAAITTGLPLLHPHPEPVNGLALGTKLVELTGLLGAFDLLRRDQRRRAVLHLRPKGHAT